MFKNLMLIGGVGVGAYAGFLHYKSMQAENKLNGKQAQKKPMSPEKNNSMNISTLQPASVPPNID